MRGRAKTPAEPIATVVVGAGQAGLATSCALSKAGVEHVVLERDRVGQTWRNRWDSFCLVTPNWSVQLPDGHYDGSDPDGFMPRDSIVALLEDYARAVEAPVRAGVNVTSLELDPAGFLVRTSAGDLQARAVVLATGAYQRPHRPAGTETLPVGLLQLDVEGYRNEHELPPGKVLVVGSGQSGCQIAEELREAGRDVVLACGRAPWVTRRIGGHDFLWWAHETGFLDVTIESLPTPDARLFANVVATGHGGGHDLHLRTLNEQGVVLAGHFLGVADGHVQFASDLHESVAWGDDRYDQFMKLVHELASDRALEPPMLDEPEPLECKAPTQVAVSELGSVVFAGGFRPDYRSWLPWPEAFDDHGFPVHHDGASTVVPGLYFVGVHFLRKRKSSLLIGVGEDAEIVARQIGETLGP